MSELKRYTNLRKKIAAGGGYEDWFIIRAQPTLGDVAKLQAFEGSDVERGLLLASTLLERWSITELVPRDPLRDPLADGEEISDADIDALYERRPVPISEKAFSELPAEMVIPVIQAAGAAANFQVASPTKSGT